MKPISNTNSFSLRRLWMVMKRDITADGMLYLGIFLGMLVLMTCLQVDFFNIDVNDRVSYFEYCIVNGYIDTAISQVPFGIWRISLPILLGYVFIMTATLCNPTAKKKSAINYLMIPATCGEKFVSRILVTVVAPLGMAVLVWFLSDLIRIPIVATLPQFSNIPAECNTFIVDDTLATFVRIFTKSYYAREGVDLPLVSNYALAAFYLYSHSLVLLGASVFRFYIARFAPFMGLVYLLFLTLNNTTIYDDMVGIYPVLTLVVFAILTLFNWWLSYYYFSHKQIVRRAGYIIRRKEAV